MSPAVRRASEDVRAAPTRFGSPSRSATHCPGPMIDQRPDRLPAQPPTVSPPPALRRAPRRATGEPRIGRPPGEGAPRARPRHPRRRTARPRSGSPACSGCSPGPSARGARPSSPTGSSDAPRSPSIPDEDPATAEALAAWLDVHAPRARARDARPPAGRRSRSSIAAAGARTARRRADAERRPRDPGAGRRPSRRADRDAGHYAVLPIPSAGDVALGFEFRRPGRRRPARRSPAADHGPPRRRRPRPRDGQLATERELAALRARDAERATFVSTVAHELRTPLTGLRGYLELILGGQVDDPAVEREFLERSRVDRRLDGRARRRPAGAVPARVGNARARDRTVLAGRGGRPGRRRAAADRDRAGHPPHDRAAAAAPGRRPAIDAGSSRSSRTSPPTR